MTAIEKRNAVIKKYEEILGRNKYSQAKRSYAFKKYSDGKYYSDCSSSIALSYKYAGYPFYDNNGSYNPNTVGMYNSKDLIDVPVEIVNGIIKNPEVLQLGDMLLFAGEDSSRAYSGYVGHVEMVGKISGSTITLYGHGSGTPRKTEMNAYCKKRFNQKTSKTKLGHKGLLKVKRFFVDGNDGKILLGSGSKGQEVKDLQAKLVKLGYDLGDYGTNKDGIDGEYGNATVKAVLAFQQKNNLDATGVVNEETLKAIEAVLNNTAPELNTPEVETPIQDNNQNQIALKPGSWNLRNGPGKEFGIAETVKKGEALEKIDPNDWIPVKSHDGKKVLWISKNAVQE